jgi:hypothetical protein
VLAKGISYKIAGLESAYSYEAMIHFILLPSSFKSDNTDLRKFQNDN